MPKGASDWPNGAQKILKFVIKDISVLGKNKCKAQFSLYACFFFNDILFI